MTPSSLPVLAPTRLPHPVVDGGGSLPCQGPFPLIVQHLLFVLKQQRVSPIFTSCSVILNFIMLKRYTFSQKEHLVKGLPFGSVPVVATLGYKENQTSQTEIML